MTTAVLTKPSGQEQFVNSWHDSKQQHLLMSDSGINNSNATRRENNVGLASPSHSCGSVDSRVGSISGDGYLRILKGRSVLAGESQSEDLISNSSNNNSSVNGEIPRQNASILAGKYLLLPSKNTGVATGASKNSFDCLNILTKEAFTCKILPRSTTGLAMLAAYHRVGESSPWVNQVVEAIMTPKVIYFIMPKNYGNVHSYTLSKKKLGEAEAANIFMQMVMAVQHCHSKGIIIRDIKLGRFVFTDKARRCVRLESLEDVVILTDPNNDNLDDKHGCPNYVSPEKAEMLKNNSKYPGKATDLWSLGVILYTMLAGRYPFNDTQYPRLLHKIRTGTISIPQGLSVPASSLLGALLCKVPSERPSCHGILKSQFIKYHCVPALLQAASDEEILPRHCSEPTSAADDQTERDSITMSSCSKSHRSKKAILDQVVPNFS